MQQKEMKHCQVSMEKNIWANEHKKYKIRRKNLLTCSNFATKHKYDKKNKIYGPDIRKKSKKNICKKAVHNYLLPVFIIICFCFIACSFMCICVRACVRVRVHAYV